ncbi:MAG: phage baseplate assembly protein V [Pseudomonadota bacterium]|nr:phage baseplate assembly protein V [Pseudomonadota bacterium]
MREWILSVIRRALDPYEREVAELRDQVEDLHRRTNGINRIGIVVAVNPAAQRCQVSHGENRSPWVKYFTPAAGDVSETRHPSLGEQCLLLNYAAGDGSAQAMALCGLPTAQFPPVSAEGNLHRRTYKDGTAEAYDDAAHRYTFECGPSSITIDHDKIELTVGGSKFRLTEALAETIATAIKLTGPTTNTGGITAAGGAAMHSTGKITTDSSINAAGDVTAGAVSLQEHQHREQGDGNLVSPPEV